MAAVGFADVLSLAEQAHPLVLCLAKGEGSFGEAETG